MSNYCQIKDVRDYMFDRSIEDNELIGDLEFTDFEIAQAMTRAARNFNSTPPFVASMAPDRMPLDTNLPLLMTAEELYKAGLQRLLRNMTDYEAGGVSVREDKVRAENFQTLIKNLRQEWKEMATHIKDAINVAGYFGSVGN